MPVRFIYFDLDDTLLDHQAAERAALADLHTRYADAFDGVSLERLRATYHARNRQLWRAYAEGSIDKETLQHHRFADVLDALGLNGTLDPDALGTTYLAHYADHWHPCPGALEAFHATADRYPVGLITNGFREAQQAKLKRFPELAARAHPVIISEEVGVLKPHPDLFAHAERAADHSADAILYVGDSYHSDVQGARRAGWHVAWYTDRTDPIAEEGVQRFASWDRFLDLLD